MRRGKERERETRSEERSSFVHRVGGRWLAAVVVLAVGDHPRERSVQVSAPTSRPRSETISPTSPSFGGRCRGGRGEKVGSGRGGGPPADRGSRRRPRAFEAAAAAETDGIGDEEEKRDDEEVDEADDGQVAAETG